MNQKMLSCIVINKMKSGILLPPPNSGKGYRYCAPDEETIIKFPAAETEYFLYPYQSITYAKDRSCKLKYRKGYKFPKEKPGEHYTVFLNSQGMDIESVQLNASEFLRLPLGVPILKKLRHDNYFCEYESFEIARPFESAYTDPYSGRITVEKSANIIKEKRKSKELDLIQKERENAYLENNPLKNLMSDLVARIPVQPVVEPIPVPDSKEKPE